MKDKAMRQVAVALTILLCASAGIARADAVGGIDAPSPPEWAAVGRLTYGAIARPGGALCTAALVAPDLILTADHCIRGRGGAAMDPHTIRFAAGWRDGRATVTGRGAAILSPAGNPVAADAAPTWISDLALVRLEAPMPGIAPLAFAGADPGLPPWSLMTFSRDRADAPAFAECRPVFVQSPALGLDCPVVSGNSGAPLLAQVDGIWRIVAVTVARNNDGSLMRALAIVPPPATRRFVAGTARRVLKSGPHAGMASRPED